MTGESRASAQRWATVVAVLAGVCVLSLTGAATSGRLSVRYWPVASDAWKTPGAESFPEADEVKGRPDFGVAFSGGGTRAAAAAIGQLRGLHRNGWLGKVRYMTAVSGGSWTAVPFVYADEHAPLDDLLGTSRPVGELTKSVLETMPPKGSLALSVVKSKLGAHSAVETAEFLARRRAEQATTPALVRSLVERFAGGGTDRTFADLLRRVFLDPVLPKDAAKRRYASGRESVDAFVEQNASLSVSDFVTTARDRPFLIVGGTIIATHPAYDYPRLIPLELTPLYSGVRQRFGPKLGGAYVWPFGYGTVADTVKDDRVSVTDGTAPFTLADVIAISGAAPLLTLFLGQPHPLIKEGVQFFPTFRPFTVVDKAAVAPDATLSHGDGGFTDNLGLMPLLARQVHNIIVFVNAKDDVARNTTVESLFRAIDRQSGSGDLSTNKVFEHDQYWKLRDGLAESARTGAAVHCQKGVKVLGNEVYNIRPYEGLNICWVYNQKVPAWENDLPADAKALLASKRFKHFPWYSTFEENKPFLIHLNAGQVNALTHLAEWTVTNPASADVIRRTLSDALQ